MMNRKIYGIIILSPRTFPAFLCVIEYTYEFHMRFPWQYSYNIYVSTLLECFEYDYFAQLTKINSWSHDLSIQAFELLDLDLRCKLNNFLF